MYAYTAHKTDLSKAQLKDLAAQFQAIRTPGELAKHLGVTAPTLEKLAAKPQYFNFHLPKPGGERRYIQNPAPPLKQAQQKLNRLLQAVYYCEKPACAHGFVLSPTDEQHPHNIYTNALAHVRGHWFLNVDLKDFFHHVTERHLHSLFRGSFGFPHEICVLLTNLCTHQRVLPMGAPTSPVLSNFALWYTDRTLMDLAKRAEGTYTRYADDLTFSFPRPPEAAFLAEVRTWLEKNGFPLNEAKTRLQGRLEQPEITGLLIGKAQKPVPSPAFLKMVKKEINIYNWLVSEAVQTRTGFPAWLFEHFRQSVVGQVEFVGFVLGKSDRTYQRLAARMRWGKEET